MDPGKTEDESRFLREVLLYREEYRKSRSLALDKEREQKHARGEVYVSGCWVPEGEVGKIVRELRRRDRIVVVEVVLLLIVFVFVAFVIWRIFVILLLPDFGN